MSPQPPAWPGLEPREGQDRGPAKEKGERPRHTLKALPQGRLPLLGTGRRSLKSLGPPGGRAT